MPPPVAHAPKHACNHFPLCKGKQKQPTGNGQPLPRLPFRAKCTESARFCSHPDCTCPAALGFKHDKWPFFCSTHYADPAHVSTRSWNLCNNAALGCRRLSTEMSRGSCLACRDGAYPCKYALVGCPLHVRRKDSSSKKRQFSCLSDESSNGCVHDLAKKRRCSAPPCPELAAADCGLFCPLCEVRNTPCPNFCGRRSTFGNN